MSGNVKSALKGWLVGLRSVQILALLVSAAFTSLALTAFAGLLSVANSEPQHSHLAPLLEVGVGVTSAALAINLISVALCITWLVYTLSPARRAKASCCGNHTPCIAFRPDVGFDSAFAVLYGIGLITGALQGTGITSVITSAIMMTLFITTAVLSSKMGRAAREQQQLTVTGFAAPPAAVTMTAPPKAVEIV